MLPMAKSFEWLEQLRKLLEQQILSARKQSLDAR